MLPKTSTYIKMYDGQTKSMYFLIENYDLLERYNTAWEKVRANIKHRDIGIGIKMIGSLSTIKK